MGLLKRLQFLDMMGPPVTLTFNGSKTLQTTFGLFMTLACFASILAASILFIRGFFDKSLPTVTDEVLAGVKQIKHHIGRDGMLPLIFVKKRSDSSMVDADVAHRYFRTALDYNFTNPRTKKTSIYRYDSTPCRNLFNTKDKLNYLAMAENYDEMKQLIDFGGYCLDVEKDNEIFVKEDLTPFDPDPMKNDRRLVVMSIQPCHVLADDPSTECGPLEDIDTFIIDVHFPVHTVNYSRIEQPVIRRIDLKNKVMLPDLTIIRFEYYFTKQHEVQDLNQVFSKTKFADSYIELTTAAPTYQFRKKDANGVPQYLCSDITCKYLYYMRFEPRFEDVIHTRRYIQLTTVLSEIGGISTLLLQVFTYLNLIYLGFARKRILVGRLFPSIPVQRTKNCFINFLEKVCCCVCCRKNHADRQELSSQSKAFWRTMMFDGFKMIDASIDLAVIFKELCSIRVLSDILMDDVQRDLVTLSSLQVFRKQSCAQDSTQGRAKTIEPTNGNQAKESLRLQQERKQQRESLEVLASRCKKKGRNKNQLSHQIDMQILKSLQDLNIDAIRAELRASPADEVQDIVKLIVGGQAFQQTARSYEQVGVDEKFPLAKMLTKVLIFSDPDTENGKEEGSPDKLDLDRGFSSLLGKFDQQDLGKIQEINVEVNSNTEDVNQEPPIANPVGKGLTASKFKLHQPKQGKPVEFQYDPGLSENI